MEAEPQFNIEEFAATLQLLNTLTDPEERAKAIFRCRKGVLEILDILRKNCSYSLISVSFNTLEVYNCM
jgi:succinate dehydrogenase flavin-adding protein (antitoxin of CptAB toxin-antitoxin module)